MPASHGPRRSGALVALAGIVATVGLLSVAPALAQGHNPFSVGISEGGGSATGFTGWLLSQQGLFERSLSAAVRAIKADHAALGWLATLSFAYGVLHAAGPGHGKAVIAAYMMADTRALRRGFVLSGLAAALQAVVAIALVGALSLVFHATMLGMRNTAAVIEKASYVGIALLGLVMVWRKGRAFVGAWRASELAVPAFARRPAVEGGLAFARAGAASGALRSVLMSERAAGPDRAGQGSAFLCAAAEDGRHAPNCGHFHGLGPAALGAGFSWREAVSTVVAAGARPCSGAILILVFAMAQGIFFAGVVSALVMALGTALTTGALAATAVLAKRVAVRLAGRESSRGVLVARGAELLAAALVLAVGVSLLLGVGPLGGLA